MPFSVNFTKLMYVGLIFSVAEVSFDLDSFSFEVSICGSSAKHNTAPKQQSAKINPVVFVLIRRSNLHPCVPSTFLRSLTNKLTAFLEPIFNSGFVLDEKARFFANSAFAKRIGIRRRAFPARF